MILLEVLFWITSGLLTLFYLTYYGLMRYAARKPTNIIKQNFTPKVTLVVATYNEGKVIQRKLSNISELQYPKNALQVIVVDSGSVDNTLELVKQFSKIQKKLSIDLLAQPKREGKASALNYCRPYCKGDIIVLTDADVLFSKDALGKLVANFADKSVGAVSGKITVLNPGQSTSTKFEKSYRSIFDILRDGESNLDSTPIFNGPISAFRKELMSDLKLDTIADDTELSLKVREKGWKAVYASQAIAYEYTPPNFKSRIKQKMRRAQGIIQSFWWHRRMIFNSKYGKYGLIIFPSEFFMHVISPQLILAMFVIGILGMVLSIDFAIRLGVLILISIVAIISILFTSKYLGNDSFNPVEMIAMFLNSQISLTLGLLLLISRKKNYSWEKIEDVRKLD